MNRPGQGRKPLPSEWKVITGTMRPEKREAFANEPEAPKDEPVMPDTLGAAGQKKWTETTDLMRQMGTLSSAYNDLLQIYCETWETYLDASKWVKKIGLAVVTKDNDTGKITAKGNPFEVCMRNNRKELVRMESELGLTPSAKSRLQVRKADPVSSRKRKQS
jgi:P27 family predicted phage terminase small subunit